MVEIKTAANGRFRKMAAVTPQTILCEFGRYYPAASAVEAATSRSRWDVIGNPCEALRQWQSTVES